MRTASVPNSSKIEDSGCRVFDAVSSFLIFLVQSWSMSTIRAGSSIPSVLKHGDA